MGTHEPPSPATSAPPFAFPGTPTQHGPNSTSHTAGRRPAPWAREVQRLTIFPFSVPTLSLCAAFHVEQCNHVWYFFFTQRRLFQVCCINIWWLHLCCLSFSESVSLDPCPVWTFASPDGCEGRRRSSPSSSMLHTLFAAALRL